MRSYLKLFLVLNLVFGSLLAVGQNKDLRFSLSGQLGWAVPQGDGVGEEVGQIDVDGGLTYAVDGLYHIMDNKLGVGLNFGSSILASVDDGLDAFGFSVIGAKGVYFLNPDKFTPFFGLTLGVATLSTPEVSVNGEVTSPSEKGSTFAIQPSIGIMFKGGFFLSADYMIPGKVTVDNTGIEDQAIGTLNINLGYRYIIDIEKKSEAEK